MRIPSWNDLKNYTGAPRNSRRLESMPISMETDMPENAPYPGESFEEFLARVGPQVASGMGMGAMSGIPAPRPVDPRAAALAQMMGNPATNPANTYNMGRTTEDFYDVPPAPGTTPVEEMMGSGQRGQPGGPIEGFGGDASMADAYGGPDPYTSGLPGATGPRTPMQNRNRRLMLYPEGTTDDEFEQKEMLGDYEDEIDVEAQEPRYRRVGEEPDIPVRKEPSTEDELDMVQKNINRRSMGPADRGMSQGEVAADNAATNNSSSFEFTGDPKADAEYILDLQDQGQDIEDLAERFHEQYGYYPDESDNAD